MTWALNNLPRPLTDGRTKILVHHARQGSKKCADMLIRGHLRLAVKLRTKAARQVPWQDALGISLLTLVAGVRRISDPTYPIAENFNFRLWISHYIKLELINALGEQRLRLMCSDTYRKYLSAGETPARILCSSSRHKIVNDTQSESLAIREAISLAVTTDREKMIVEQLGAGSNLSEIAKDLHLSRERLRQIVENIRTRLIDYADVRKLRRGNWSLTRRLSTGVSV